MIYESGLKMAIREVFMSIFEYKPPDEQVPFAFCHVLLKLILYESTLMEWLLK